MGCLMQSFDCSATIVNGFAIGRIDDTKHKEPHLVLGLG
jgi:hypothetical protein